MILCMLRHWLNFAMVVAMAFVLAPMPLQAQMARIKDLTSFKGKRPNQLIGFGLVVGLANTGDTKKSLATNRAVANMLTHLGMAANPDGVVTQSIAAVVVTAELPAFAKSGDRIDIKASVIGDAKSLAGGTLIQTQLKAGDGEVYAVAQGPIVLGKVSGQGSQSTTVGAIPSGALIEREFQSELVEKGVVELNLRVPDFTTAARIAEHINKKFKGFYAEARDPAAIKIVVPQSYRSRLVEFLSELENLEVMADQPAVVVLNERTGTVVMGANVTISDVAVSHGDLAITVGEGRGSRPESLVKVKGTTVGDLAKSLNALGIKPADLVGIIQAIHAAGGLKAELKFL